LIIPFENYVSATSTIPSIGPSLSGEFIPQEMGRSTASIP